MTRVILNIRLLLEENRRLLEEQQQKIITLEHGLISKTIFIRIRKAGGL